MVAVADVESVLAQSVRKNQRIASLLHSCCVVWCDVGCGACRVQLVAEDKCSEYHSSGTQCEGWGVVLDLSLDFGQFVFVHYLLLS